MKKLIVSKSAGFCFGVSRSVIMAEKMLESGGKCFSYGELIHNNAVVSDLKNRGLVVVKSASELPNNAKVIIRSHGISRKEHEELMKSNSQIFDATCPKVIRIHQIVSEASIKGRTPIIIGMAKHPEVLAIRGWCEKALVFPDCTSFHAWLLDDSDNCNKPITVVFQTTQTKKMLDDCNKISKKLCTNCEVFDTICNATSTRQEEARKLASVCDTMVVIGDKHSANSLHLAEICEEHCKNVQFIANSDELNVCSLADAETIGITAGASAPAWIIKEVKQKMCDEIKIDEAPDEQIAMPASEMETPTPEEISATDNIDKENEKAEGVQEAEKSFDELLEDSIKTIYNGDTVTGIVAAITPTEVSVELFTKHSGYIPVSEFTDDNTAIDEIIKVGDEIEACVVRVNDVEGTVMLSKKRLDAIKYWNTIEAAHEDGTVLEGIVNEENKGGIVVNVKGIRVFVPASQSGLGKDAPMTDLMKQKVRLKITEVNRSRRRVVGSIRAVLNKERKERSEKVWSDIEIGKRYTGVVKSLTSYGAFVDIGGVDGMIHVSELSWKRIRQPSDMLSVGDSIEVYIINFDKDTHRISLGYKDPTENPWVKFTSSNKVEDVVNVKIVKLMTFGAFAEILPGVDGLIHISQIANRRIGKPDEVLEVGQLVDAKITNIDEEKQKVSLSIRALIEPEPVKDAPSAQERVPSTGDALVYEVSEAGEATGIAIEDAEENACPEGVSSDESSKTAASDNAPAEEPAEVKENSEDSGEEPKK